MRFLDFKVNGQVLQKTGDFSNLVAGTSDYLFARFSFSSEWNGTVKVAEFKGIPVLLKNNVCQIPGEALKYNTIDVNVEGRRGTYKIITNSVEITQAGGING